MHMLPVVTLAEGLWPVFSGPDNTARARRLTALLLSSGRRPAISPGGFMTWTTENRSPGAEPQAAISAILASTIARIEPASARRTLVSTSS